MNGGSVHTVHAVGAPALGPFTTPTDGRVIDTRFMPNEELAKAVEDGGSEWLGADVSNIARCIDVYQHDESALDGLFEESHTSADML
eukprot:CAMPEP_0184403378 /NCGR_PEP_ID=MMETSP0007-20130409/85379_1 /TAXON_ID=97485 /ORGANISM="Prymnesium parvum, Strain Texoma1" /LENGTH=86 /DNA_ID=CAMNT_0026759477 /DNA_START=74 /DNA_END=335 /DNA_ORIENTATION=+